MFFLTRPGDARLQTILAQSRESSPTYKSVGATQRGGQPAGYRHDRYTTDLGFGEDVWDWAVMGLRQWAAHTGAGLNVLPAGAPLIANETVLVLMKAGPIHVVAPCRIVGVFDEPRRYGFAYGTLPGHPEEGEESFVIQADATGQVHFDVTAFSRPAETLAKIGSPAAQVIQARVTNRYLAALRQFVSAR